MILESARFTERSSSIIDLIFASNKNSILLSGVGEKFLGQIVRYYQSLSRDIRKTDWELLKSNDTDIYTSNIINRISELSDKHIPNKKVKITQSDLSWLTNEAKN